MTKQEFIELINLSEEISDFEIYGEEDDDDTEIIISCVDVKITFNDDNTFNIYRDFCYPLKDCEENFENEYKTALQEITVKHLESRFNDTPNEEFECGMGCPFDALLVGYWNNQFNIDFVIAFIKECERAETEDIENDVSKLIMESISDVSDKFNLFRLNEESFISRYRDITIFTKDIKALNLDNIDVNDLTFVELPVIANNYFFGKNHSGQVIAVDIKKIHNFFVICDHFNVDKANFDFYCIGNEYLYIKGIIKAIIPLELNPNDKIDGDYFRLAIKLNALKKIKPRVDITSLNFSHLSYNQFELLCYDILNEQGFTNVHLVGNANAPDGGKDIIADEEYKTISGTERRKWIWQCKHSKKSLSRKDVSEIKYLVNENKAAAYGLFCSSSLTPDLINRLEMKNDGSLRIIYYGKVELETLLSRFPDLLVKYKLM